MIDPLWDVALWAPKGTTEKITTGSARCGTCGNVIATVRIDTSGWAPRLMRKLIEKGTSAAGGRLVCPTCQPTGDPAWLVNEFSTAMFFEPPLDKCPLGRGLPYVGDRPPVWASEMARSIQRASKRASDEPGRSGAGRSEEPERRTFEVTDEVRAIREKARKAFSE